MNNYQIAKGSTNVSLTIRIIDSTDGTPETGVVAATAGLVLNYRREGAANVSLAVITNLAALTTAHTDKGIIHIGNGYYRVDVPDAAFATGVDGVLVHGVATGMVVIGAYVQLTDVDLMDGVRAGMTALPAFAAGTAGGLPDDTDANGAVRIVDGTGAREINTNAGAIALVDLVTTTTTNTDMITAATVNAQCDLALSDIGLDHLIAVADADTPVNNSIIAKLASATSDWSTFDPTTDSQEALRNSIITLSVTGTSDSGSTTTMVDAARTEPNNYWIGDLIRFTSGTLAAHSAHIIAFSSTTITFYPAAPVAVSTHTYEIIPGPSLRQVIFDTDMGDHQIADSFGQAIGDPNGNSKTLYAALIDDAVGASVTADVATVDGNIAALNDPTAATIADTVWDELQSAHVTAGSFGEVATEIAGILADTNELQTDDVPGLIATAQADLDIITGADGVNLLSATQTSIDAIETDTGTTIPGTITTLQADTDDIQTRLPAALVSGKMDSDATAISGDTTAADRLEALMDGTIVAQVNDAIATTTAFAADGFTEATDDHFNGRLITFITGALAGQQTDITGYDAAGGAQGSQELTVTALTEAPADNDFFVIH